MATYWLGAGGNDGNNGTTYALRKLTTGSALALLTSKGDVLNIVGSVDMDAANYEINGVSLGNAGTSYVDPALTIQGTDSDGQPAMATLLGDATHAGFLTLDDRVNYSIIQGVHFDMSTQPNNFVKPLIVSGLGHTPVKLQYCIFEGDNTKANFYLPQFPLHEASFNGAQVSGHPEVLAQYCVFKAAFMSGDNAGTVHADHCIFYWKDDDLSGPGQFVQQQTGALKYWVGAKMTNCTLDVRQNHASAGTGRCFALFFDNVGDATVVDRDRKMHSNLICLSSSELMAPSQLFNSGIVDNSVANITGTWSGTVGHNCLVFDDNVVDSIAATNTVDYYTDHYHPDQPTTTTGTELYPTDVIKAGTVIGDIINATSAWTWVDVNDGGYNLDLDKDYRVTNTTLRTFAQDDGVVGAVGDSTNEAPTAVSQTQSATSGVTKVVSAVEGLLKGATDPEGDTLTATIVAGPSHGSVVLVTTTGAYDYTPNITFTGTDLFTFQVEDPLVSSNVATATLNVTNLPPIASNMSYTVLENNQKSYDSSVGLLSLATDPDVGQTLSVTGVGAVSHGTLVSYNITTGSFVYRPDDFFTGADSFEFQITDGNTLSGTYTANIDAQSVGDSTSSTFIDTAPFYRPTLKVATEFRMTSSKNRTRHHDLSNYTEDLEWNESTHRVMYVGVSTTVQVTLGGVAEAQYMIVETDEDIDVSINDTSRYWTISKCAAIALGSITTIYLKNNSATNLAQVKLCVSD